MTLLAAYAYDEGSGTTTADASGNGHTATLNSASWTASGHTNSGITNTTTAQGATSTVPAVTTAAVTLMAWVKPLDLAAGTSHLACGILQSFNGSTDIGLWTQRGDFSTSNVLQGNIRINGNLSAVNGAALTVGTWAHLALTYDGTTIRLYKDGTQVATVSNAGPISLGTTLYVAGGGPDTDVVVDDVRYYNEVLDDTAITTAMNTPVSGGSVVALDGTAPAAGSATGTLSANRPLTGLASTAAGATGQLAAARAFDGISAAASLVTGALSATRPLAGMAVCASSATADLTVTGSSVALDGIAPAASYATGTLTAARVLAGVAPAASDLRGALTAARPLSGVAAAVSSAHGVLTVSSQYVAAEQPKLTIVPNLARLTISPNRATATLGDT